jgi:hypothetical protein
MSEDEQKLPDQPREKRRIKKLHLKIRHLSEELVQAAEIQPDYEMDFSRVMQMLRKAAEQGNPELKQEQPKNTLDDKANEAAATSPELDGKQHDKAYTDDGASRHHEPDVTHAPQWMKKAYKQIAMKTHPDHVSLNKGLSPYEIANHQRLFNIARVAIEEQNGADIVYVAEQLGIEINLPVRQRIALMASRVDNIKTELAKIYKTPAWMWGESYGNPVTRRRIISAYCKIYKFVKVDDIFIDKFMTSIEELN